MDRPKPSCNEGAFCVLGGAGRLCLLTVDETQPLFGKLWEKNDKGNLEQDYKRPQDFGINSEETKGSIQVFLASEYTVKHIFRRID